MTGSNEPAREGRSEGLFDVPRFIALIPARLASTRLPDKPLADIGGKPMIVRVAEQASRSGAWKVAVATDAPSVAAAVSAAGFAVVMTRADHPSGTDRLAEAAIQLGLADDELVVNVQGDEPLIEPELIAAVARTLAGAPDCAIATAAHRIDLRDDYLNPNVVKVVLDAAGRALYFSRAPIPYDRDRLATTSNNPSVTPKAVLSDETSNPGDLLTTGLSEHDLPLRHIGIYAYRTSFLRRYPQLAESPLEVLEKLEQLRAMWHGYRIAVHRSDVASPPGVDTLADLQRVRAVLAARAVNGAPR